MSPLTVALLQSLTVLLAAMILLWLVSLALRNASIVDPFWGIGFVLVTWFTLATGSGFDGGPRTWLVTSLVTVWGIRLSLYLLWRNRGHGEDKRYRAMREHHGTRFWWVSLLTVFVLQGLILWFVSIPIQAVVVSHNSAVETLSAADSPLNWLDAFGVVVWCLGLFFETVGDLQMAGFQSDPANAGKVMDRGLWRYTRHPNYFGDFCIWWGIYLVAVSGGAAWTIFSPLLMSFLLLKVSGVTLLEKTITARRPDYAAYQRRTSSFFPRPPRRLSSPNP